MSKHGQNHNEQNPLDTMERNDTRTPQEVLESAEAVKARLHEQTLRPVSEVAAQYNEPTAIDVQIELTTDRDAAYTMLKTMIEGKRLPRYKKGAFIEHRNQTNAIYNTAIDHILTLLDTIYGKTHTV